MIAKLPRSNHTAATARRAAAAAATSAAGCAYVPTLHSRDHPCAPPHTDHANSPLFFGIPKPCFANVAPPCMAGERRAGAVIFSKPSLGHWVRKGQLEMLGAMRGGIHGPVHAFVGVRTLDLYGGAFLWVGTRGIGTSECVEGMLWRGGGFIRGLSTPVPNKSSDEVMTPVASGLASASGPPPVEKGIVVNTPDIHVAIQDFKAKEPEDKSLKGRIKTGWEHFKHEMQHYWLGTKLLGKEVSICYNIVKQITRGEELSRREYRQLKTTSADLLKMIPMAIFVIVPFMELALPVALYFFPGILPSTFKHEWKKEDEMKRSLKARIEVARFLQDAMNDMAHQVVRKYPMKKAEGATSGASGKEKGDAGAGGDRDSSATAAEFQQFMKRVQMGDARVTNVEILKFCKLFTDDITLDNVGRLQLVNLCRLLDIPVVGPDSFLKYRLIERMRAIRADDRMIQAEGVESLSYYELREALAYRGMRSLGLSHLGFKEELKNWLDLHLNKNVPTTLLLMSRAFKITQKAGSEEGAIKDTLQAMPFEATASAEAMALEKNKVTEKQKKLEELSREQRLIEQERIERQEMLVADLHSSAGRFLDNNAPNWLREQIDVQALAKDTDGLLQKRPKEEDKETDTPPPSPPGETGLVAALTKRFGLVEEELLVYVTRSLQPRFTMVDLKAKQYALIIQAELAARRSRLIAGLLEAPAESKLLEPPSHSAAKAQPLGGGHALGGGGATSLATAEVPAVVVVATGKTSGIRNSAHEELLDYRVVNEVAEMVSLMGSKDATEAEKEMLEEIKSQYESVKSELDAVKLVSESATAKSVTALRSRLKAMVLKLDADVQKTSEKIGSKFSTLDADGDGLITADDIKVAIQTRLNRTLEAGELEAIIKTFDVNKDGKIDLEEVEDIREALSKARHELLTSEEEVLSVKMPEILTMKAEDMDDTQAALWGSLLEDYRDKLNDLKDLRELERRLERERDSQEKAAMEEATRAAELAEAKIAQAKLGLERGRIPPLNPKP